VIQIIFNKEKFIENAPKGIIRQLLPCLDDLDGKEVLFKNGEQFGIIPQCFSNGLEYYLYPVYKNWCTDKQLPGQMSIMDFIGGQNVQ
jgi:hypothetical protein